VKRVLVVLGIVLLVGVPVAISWSTRDVRSAPPELTGPIWRGDAGGERHVVYVTREARGRRVYHGSSRAANWYTQAYSRFALDVRRIPDGALASSIRLADMKNVDDLNAPRVVGVAGDVVWTWRDSLEAWRLPGLTRLPVAASAMLPREPAGYRMRPDTAALVARGRDARYYTVHADGRAPTPLDASTLPPSSWNVRSADDRFDRLATPANRSLSFTRPNNVTQREFGTPTGLWYALLSESERATLSPMIGGGAHPSGVAARSLYRAPYRVDGRRAAIDTAQVTPLGTERMIEGGFLERTGGRVWDVADPSSTLVLARAAAGSQEPWDVLRLARDGRVLWRTTTELADPHARLDLGMHLLLVGQEIGSGRAGGGRPRDLFVWIDERTGARRVLSVATGTVR